MQRFHLPNVPGPTVATEEADLVHQIARVLRSKEGDRVELFSEGGGGVYEIVSIGKRSVSFSRISETAPSGDPDARIVLFQSIPNRYEKIEYLLQKGVEVGVSEFVFFAAERSQKLSITENKVARFEAIVREAVEQCGGYRLPKIRFEKGFPAVPTGMPIGILHTGAVGGAVSIGKFVRRLPKVIDRIGVFVGPEWGFTDAECDLVVRLGATPIRAGDRILRTETAGVVAAFSMLRFLETPA